MSCGQKRSKRSVLWSYFTPVNDVQKIALCNICQNKISYCSTITNMKSHLQKKHPTINMCTDNRPPVFRIIVPSSTASSLETGSALTSTSSSVYYEAPTTLPIHQASPSNTFFHPGSQTQSQLTACLPTKISEAQKYEIDRYLMNLFILDFQPFSILNDPGFIEFVSALNPSYQLPDRKVITKEYLPAIYEQCLNNVREKLCVAQSACLTIDCWTSKHNESSLALTAHFISPDFEMCSVFLESICISESHTSSNFGEQITNILNKFNLRDKVFIVVTKDDSNMKCAITEYLNLDQFSCYAHTLNLIVQDSLKQIREIHDKVKTIVTYFKINSLANEKLISYQKNAGIQMPKKVIDGVATRWNSTYYMLQRFVELKESIEATAYDLNKNLPALTEEEWKICGELCVILQPFEETTCKLSREKYITASQVIIFTNGLAAVCKNILKENFSAVSLEVAKELLDGITERLGNIELTKPLALCTILDPRFKLIGFSNGDHAKATKDFLIDMVRTHINEGKYVTQEPHQCISTVKVENRFSIWEDFEKRAANIPQTSGISTAEATVEVARYLNQKLLPRNQDPLQWWKNHQHLYPTLAKLVKKKFCMVASSVPSESVFSKTGSIITEKRCRLSSTHANEILFLHSNYNLMNKKLNTNY